MRVKLDIQIPAAAEISKGLSIESDAAVRRARQAVEQARADAASAAEGLRAASAEVNRITGEVALGRAAVTDLERAILAQKTAALLVTPTEGRVREPELALRTAEATAKSAAIADAGRRRDDLQALADRIAPALTALREAEAALDLAVIPLGAQCVAPVIWPSCAEDEAAYRRAGFDLGNMSVRTRMLGGTAASAVGTEPAILAQQTAARLVTPTEGRVREAEHAPHTAEATARSAVMADADRRRDDLRDGHRTDMTRPPIEQSMMIAPLDRRAAITRTNDAARTASLVWSTGADVERADWQTGRKYLERLSLDPKHVRLERLNSGAPLLNAHSADSLADVIGTVEPGSVELRPDEALATVRFSKRADVEPIYQDVRDRIVRNVSVGYRVYRFEQQEQAKGELPRWLAVDWEPFEISMVPMAADAGARVRKPSTDVDTNPCLLVGPGDQGDDAERGRRLQDARLRS